MTEVDPEVLLKSLADEVARLRDRNASLTDQLVDALITGQRQASQINALRATVGRADAERYEAVRTRNLAQEASTRDALEKQALREKLDVALELNTATLEAPKRTYWSEGELRKALELVRVGTHPRVYLGAVAALLAEHEKQKTEASK